MTAQWRLDPHVDWRSRKVKSAARPNAVARLGLTTAPANARNRFCKKFERGYERDGRSLGAGQFTRRSSCLCGRQLSFRPGDAEGRDEPHRRGSRRGALCRPHRSARDLRRLGRQHHRRRRLVWRRGRLYRQGKARPARRDIRRRHPLDRGRFLDLACRARTEHRALLHLCHAGWRADDEHLSRRELLSRPRGR